LEELSHNYDCVECNAFEFDDESKRRGFIQNADLVISMLPARFHLEIAKDCILFKKNLMTASYVSDEIRKLEKDIIKAGITFICEIGVDPGIDHLSAKKVIDEITEKGGEVLDFETFTGGLLAPESDNNPWGYKFTWNPRNVVLAGRGATVKFIQEGSYKYIPYHKLFRRTELIEVDEYGKFEGIANRDSLKYRKIYGLENIRTMYRGTLRRPGFCRAWDAFVQLGVTDDSFVLPDSEHMTFREFFNLFLPYNPTDSVELKLRHYLNLAHDEIELFEKLKWLDIFEDIPIGIKNATPAQALQKILERKWSLEAEDKDMIVMWHKFVYQFEKEEKEIHSSMIVKGDDQQNTAMAKTVGLPLGIASKMVLNNEFIKPGIHIPIHKELYLPILQELENFGISFQEKVVR